MDAHTLAEVHEPFLIQGGYIQRTPQGRVLSSKGYQAIGLADIIRKDPLNPQEQFEI